MEQLDLLLYLSLTVSMQRRTKRKIEEATKMHITSALACTKVLLRKVHDSLLCKCMDKALEMSTVINHSTLSSVVRYQTST